MTIIPPTTEVTVFELHRLLYSESPSVESSASDELRGKLGWTYPRQSFATCENGKSAQEDGDSTITAACGTIERLPPLAILRATLNITFWMNIFQDYASSFLQYVVLKTGFHRLLGMTLHTKRTKEAIHVSGLLAWHGSLENLAVINKTGQIYLQDALHGSKIQVLKDRALEGISAMEWRSSTDMLSVACSQGVFVLDLSPCLSQKGILFHETKVSGSSSSSHPPLTTHLLPTGPLAAMKWSHDGQYLAYARAGSSQAVILNYSAGNKVALEHGLGKVNFVQWSPDGRFLVVAHRRQLQFFVVSSRACLKWKSEDQNICSVAFSPNGMTVIVAFADCTSLGVIQLHQSAPEALPCSSYAVVDLPELSGLAALSNSAIGITSVALDATGQRLAVCYKGGNDCTSGLVALFDVNLARETPSFSLIGFIRGGSCGTHPLAAEFHKEFSRGALLAISWSSEYLGIYPLIFKA